MSIYNKVTEVKIMFGIGNCFGFGRGVYGAGVYGPGGGSWILPVVMGISRIVLLAVIIYFVYRLLVKNRQNHNISSSSSSSAMGILNERFAKGEISEEEYNARKKQLQM
jgi:putative membrane protein